MPELARIESIVFLQSVDFFTFCSAEEILRLASIAHERHVAADEQLYKAHEPANRVYCVVKGKIHVTDAAGNQHAAGPLQTLAILDILSGRLHTGSAIAAADSLVLEIEAEDLFDLLSNNIEIVKSVFRHLIHRLERQSMEGIPS